MSGRRGGGTGGVEGGWGQKWFLLPVAGGEDREKVGKSLNKTSEKGAPGSADPHAAPLGGSLRGR